MYSLNGENVALTFLYNIPRKHVAVARRMYTTMENKSVHRVSCVDVRVLSDVPYQFVSPLMICGIMLSAFVPCSELCVDLSEL